MWLFTEKKLACLLLPHETVIDESTGEEYPVNRLWYIMNILSLLTVSGAIISLFLMATVVATLLGIGVVLLQSINVVQIKLMSEKYASECNKLTCQKRGCN